MSNSSNANGTVIRTPRGLTVGGSRLTIYSLMDHFKAGHSDQVVGEWYRLTPEQMADIHRYIDEHQEEVEAEYQEVVQAALAEQRYWEERNRGRLEELTTAPQSPEQQRVRDKIAELRNRTSRP
jgi:uncharacterized protein (DUF433 family)